MISVAEAKAKILETVVPRPSVQVTLAEARGRILAEEIRSPFDLPLFTNSAMDGYAVRGADHPVLLTLVATVAAGEILETPLPEGSAVRIFTGAMLPDGADAVVKQEEVIQSDQKIRILRPVSPGENVRYRGEELKQGDLLLAKGGRLSSGAIGLLATVGLHEVPVHLPPKVGLLVTGSEIVTDPKNLAPGKILDSNSFALAAALQELGLVPSFIRRCRDEKGSLLRSVQEGLETVDFLMVTGGVSVGDFDFVREVAQEIGVQEIFWKVKQKPGKPIFFGKGGTKFLFGLPGNPVSTLVCYYEYVRPALLATMGASDHFLPALRMPLAESFRKKPGLMHFLRGKFSASRVEILPHQSSHMMTSFAQANCLIIVPEHGEEVKEGDEVEIHLLPQ